MLKYSLELRRTCTGKKLEEGMRQTHLYTWFYEGQMLGYEGDALQVVL